MKKLELSHLAPYLPYGLKLQYYYPDNEIGSTGLLRGGNIDWACENHRSCVKPILRQLSDLEGTDFKELNLPYGYPDFGHFERSVLSGHANYELVIQLASDHYDIFGLIELGLAIDINTI